MLTSESAEISLCLRFVEDDVDEEEEDEEVAGVSSFGDSS